MLIVTGRLTVAASDFAAFAADLRALAETARAADGCAFFAVGVEDALRGEMLVCEYWHDMAAQRVFLQGAAFELFARRWREKLQNGLRAFEAQEFTAS